MRLSYYYRVEVATGCADEVRALLERSATVGGQDDGPAAASHATTVLRVAASGLESLRGLKSWADGHPLEELTLISALGRRLSVRDADAASLRAAVQSYVKVEPAPPAPTANGPVWRYQWRAAGPPSEGG